MDGFLWVFFPLFIAVGSLGTYRYLRNYWVYRGFPPPSDPAYVTQRGSVEQIKVASAAQTAGSANSG